MNFIILHSIVRVRKINNRLIYSWNNVERVAEKDFLHSFFVITWNGVELKMEYNKNPF